MDILCLCWKKKEVNLYDLIRKDIQHKKGKGKDRAM